ncbi:MAG: GNAT family N-acetyltransferase [Aliishimia sp.]
MDLTVRVLTPADQPAWRNLRLEALAQFPEAFLMTHDEQRGRPAADDRAMLAQGTWRGLYDGSDLVGMAAVLRQNYATARHRAELGALYVSLRLWGQGAAQQFLDALEQELRTKAALQIELSVAVSNDRAIRFYERNGYTRFGIQPRAVIVDGVPTDDAFYVKLLDQDTHQ